MKKTFILLASLMVMIAMICSCGGGSGSADAEDVVAVRLGVNMPSDARVGITSTSTDMMTGSTFQYKAAAKWTSADFGTPKGTQTSWTDFSVTEGTGSIGYFAVGQWDFEVRLIKKGASYNASEPSTYTVLYQTSQAVTKYVNPSTTEIEITVDKVVDTGNGFIKVNGVQAPTCGASEKLVMTWGPVGGAQAGTLDLSAGTPASGYTPWSTTGDGQQVAAGTYWVTLTRNDGSNTVGAATTIVEIFKGCTETIEGKVESGAWVSESLTITGLKSISCTFSAAATSVTKGSSLNFTVSGTLTPSGTIKYYFCCNGERTDITAAISTNTYEWSTTSILPGNYEISIIATDSTGSVAASPAALKVTVNP